MTFVRLCFTLALVAALSTCTKAELVTADASSLIRKGDSSGLVRTSHDEPPIVGRLDESVRAMQRDRGVAGVSVSVVWQGKPVLVQGYGLADVQKNVSMSAGHIFRIGSITKSFTAAAILLLEAQGKLKLADPLVTHLPQYTASNAVTLWHLLTHSSGIPDYLDIPNFGAQMMAAETRSGLAAWFAGLPLQFAPGTDWSYSNSGYFLLGLVIEAVSGLSYRDFLRTEILAPAGLSDTQYCPDTQNFARAASGYKLKDGMLVPDDPAVMKLSYSAGALCSTASDLVKWFVTLSKGSLSANASFSRMIGPTMLSSGRSEPYGFGLALRDLGGHVRVGHYGDISGFAGAIHYYLNDDLYIAVLVNTEGSAAKMIAEQIARTVLKLEAPRP